MPTPVDDVDEIWQVSRGYMMLVQTAALKTLYEEHLLRDILPFWVKAIDPEYGGVYTYFNNTGDTLISTDKNVQAQGRFVWILSKLIEMGYSDRDYHGLAVELVGFIKKHSLLGDGRCALLLDREGRPKEPSPGKGLDSSIYADCFVVLGLTKYATITKDSSALTFALTLYESVVDRIDQKTYRIDPMPPTGYEPHGIPMFLLNTSQEMFKALEAFAHPKAAMVKARRRAFLSDIIENFITEDDNVMELRNKMVKDDDSLLGRYVNPGLCLQDMWFVLDEAAEIGDVALISRVARIVERMFKIGWDDEFGGLFLFVDKDGGSPKGTSGGSSDDCLIVQSVKSSWQNKLWWPQIEAMYTTLLCYFLTGRVNMMKLHHKVREYAFKTFPNPDKNIGEWIQMRNRAGIPLQNIGSKDLFHITRGLLLMIDLLIKMNHGQGGIIGE